MSISAILGRLHIGNSTASEAVCSRCKNLSPQPDQALDVRIPIRTLKKLKPKDVRCAFCTLIKDVYDWQYSVGLGEVTGVVLHCSEGRPVVMWFEWSGYDEFQLWFLLHKPHGVAVSAWPSLGGPARASGHLGSGTSLQFIRGCLDECLSECDHQNCSQGTGKLLPTRLLDVALGCIKLCDTTPGESGDYCALSYCWGPPEHNLQTKKENIDRMRSSIDWDSLPPLLKDAVTLTRWLGIRYLWIDALCIIQGDKQDWEAEAPKMGQYYREAVLTIAASSAADVRAPFLTTRSPLDEKFAQNFQFRSDEDTNSTIVARRVPEYGGMFLAGFCPLASRAWTFQENVLSTRIVHFTPSEIIWECRSQQVYENGGRLKCPIGLAFRLADGERAANKSASASWKALVAEYTKRKLTHDSDRLAAISGIASHFDPLIQGRYLAGIWERCLASDLTWTSSWNTGPPVVKPLTEMPSWTWASAEGTVFQDFDFCETTGDESPKSAVRLVDIQCALKGANRFGDVSPGSALVVEGLVFSAELSNSPSADPFSVRQYTLAVDGDVERMDSLFGFSPDTLLVPVEVAGGKKCTARRATREELLLGGAPHVAPKFPPGVEVQCLYLGGGRFKGVGNPTFSSLPSVVDKHFYLVLGCCGEGYDGVSGLCRLGLVACHAKPPRRAKKRCVKIV